MNLIIANKKSMQKITPFLWFENNAEEAVEFYMSIFKNAKIINKTYYSEDVAKASGQKQGTVMTVEFEIEGQEFIAINGGKVPGFQFSPAISFVVNCDTQEEIDHYWEKLSADGGESGQCGWINHDKYGITWQITPKILVEMLAGKNKEKSANMMKAMLKMTKLNIAELEKAFNGES